MSADTQLVCRLKRRPTSTADYSRAVSTSEGITDLESAIWTVKGFFAVRRTRGIA